MVETLFIRLAMICTGCVFKGSPLVTRKLQVSQKTLKGELNPD